jgi:hypothetical protein
MISEHRRQGTLDETPIRLLPPAVNSSSLRFPGKVAIGPGNLLAVADSGHNRVVVACAGEAGGTAEVLAVAGSGARGAADGGFHEVRFTDPQGLVFLDEETLFVADTGTI